MVVRLKCRKCERMVEVERADGERLDLRRTVCKECGARYPMVVQPRSRRPVQGKASA